jgi:hypothetical protein
MNPVIESLVRKHRRIERTIRDELRRRLPDSLRLQRLKKAKLALKDRLSALDRGGERETPLGR